MAGSNQTERPYRYPIADDMAPSRATYLAVAAAKDCDSLALPPLGETVDADSLDALTVADGVTATFDYADCSVTITEKEVRVDDRV